MNKEVTEALQQFIVALSVATKNNKRITKSLYDEYKKFIEDNNGLETVLMKVAIYVIGSASDEDDSYPTINFERIDA